MALGAFDLGEKFTIAMWVKLQLQAAPQILSLFTNVVGGVGTDGLKLFINEYGTINLRIITEAGTGGPGAGHGVLQGTATNFAAQSAVNTAGGLTEFPNNFANNTPAFIGTFFGSALWFKGWMDDFRIYGKVLSPDEIAHIAKQQ